MTNKKQHPVNKKEIRFIILFVLLFFGGAALLIWLLIEFAPYLLFLAALPAWLFAALNDGANV